jgi:hypothetical protein
MALSANCGPDKLECCVERADGCAADDKYDDNPSDSADAWSVLKAYLAGADAQLGVELAIGGDE